MKRWQISLFTCALLILLSGNALAQPTDVSPGHWAYKAVQTLVERGYMETGQGDRFDGTRSAQRYDVAVAVGRLLDDIEAGRVRLGSGLDTEMLRALEREFRDELVQWHRQSEQLERAHAQTQRQLGVIDEQLNLLLLALDDLDIALRTELETGLQREGERRAELREYVDGRMADLREAINLAFGQYGDSIGAQFGEQLNALEAVRAELAQLHEDVGRQHIELATQIDGLHTSNERLGSVVAGQQSDLEDLDLRMNNYINDHAAALAMRLDMTERTVEGLVGELAQLQDVLGTSEDQIARMTDRVKMQLDEQLSWSMLREQQLQRELDQLRADFERYRSSADAEVKSARTMSTIAVGAAAVILLLGLGN